MRDIENMKNKYDRELFVKSLKEKRDKAGFNDASLSKAAGLNATAVRDIIQVHKNMPRYDTLEALSRALNCSVNALVKNIEDEVLEGGSLIPVKIKGYVQAGNWGEANELDLGEVVMSVSTEYPSTYGLIVKGDSMNLKYPEGTNLTCVPVLDYDKDIKSGNSVIVEAICAADEIETTVKEYYQDEDGNNWLLPKSSNPIHQNYPVPNGEDIDLIINGRRIKEIKITAIVTGSWKSEV